MDTPLQIQIEEIEIPLPDPCPGFGWAGHTSEQSAFEFDAMDAKKQFLHLMMSPGVAAGGRLIIYNGYTAAIGTFTDVDAAIKAMDCTNGDWHFAVGLLRRDMTGKGKHMGDDVGWIPAMVGDLDSRDADLWAASERIAEGREIAALYKKLKEQQPLTDDEVDRYRELVSIGKGYALAKISAFPLQPTALWETGAGFQFAWVFPEPVKTTTDTGELNQEFKDRLKRVAKTIPGDAVYDYARIMRIPGTTYGKRGPFHGAPITLHYCNTDQLHTMAEIEMAFRMCMATDYSDCWEELPAEDEGGDKVSVHIEHSAEIVQTEIVTAASTASGSSPTGVLRVEALKNIVSVLSSGKWLDFWRNGSGRHEAALAMSGLFRSRGIAKQQAREIMAAIATSAVPCDRQNEFLRAVESTYDQTNSPTTGMPRLTECVGQDRAGLLATALSHGSPISFPPLKKLGEPAALPEFPVEVLPPVFRHQVLDVANTIQVPVGIPGICALGVAALAAAKKFKVRVSPSHTEPVNLYLCSLSPPGERKSAAFAAMLRPVHQAARDLRILMEPEIRKVTLRADTARERVKHLRSKAAKSKDTPNYEALIRDAEELEATIIEPKVIPTLCTGGDATAEALAGLCAENDGRIAQVDAEAGALIRMFNAYQTSGSPPQIEFHLKAHSGDYYSAARVGRSSPAIQEPALTLLLTGQPEVFCRMKDKALLRARGLLGRFLVALPESLVGHRVTHEIKPDARAAEAYAQDVRYILSINSPATAEDPDYCYELSLTPEARSLWANFAGQIETTQAEGGKLADLRDFASKLAGAVARIAGLLTIMEASIDSKKPISGETMAGAIKLGHYFLAHWRAVHELSGAGHDVEIAKRILHCIERNKTSEISTADLWRALRHGGLESPSDLNAPLADLVNRGYLQPIPASPGQRLGRPETLRYLVRPGWLA